MWACITCFSTQAQKFLGPSFIGKIFSQDCSAIASRIRVWYLHEGRGSSDRHYHHLPISTWPLLPGTQEVILTPPTKLNTPVWLAVANAIRVEVTCAISGWKHLTAGAQLSSPLVHCHSDCQATCSYREAIRWKRPGMLNSTGRSVLQEQGSANYDPGTKSLLQRSFVWLTR